ncbi:MAG: hypothetical protein JSS79_12895 [Bacteroidetes bacterium]|nr:hypothetical protein [Bacteroidota bacterium]
MERNNEDLFLQSLDGTLDEAQKQQLKKVLAEDAGLQRASGQYLALRDQLLRKETDSFGPFFAERIINRIKSLKKEIDYQIFFFFKKYQLAALGVVVALLVLNIIFSDQLTLKSVLGFEDEKPNDIVTIDLYQDLTE